MSYERDAHRVATALTHIAHAFTRLANAHQRLADAAEEANRIASLHYPIESIRKLHDSALAPIVLSDKGTEADPTADDISKWGADDL